MTPFITLSSQKHRDPIDMKELSSTWIKESQMDWNQANQIEKNNTCTD